MHAGFGITPPYVKNETLARGSEFVQTIILTRSDPLEDLKAEVTINVPGASDWIRIDKGETFTLPKGETQVPMAIKVNVPTEAKFGAYTGNIRVVISSLETPTPGVVGITLGAQIDVAINVIDKKIYDFVIHGVKLEDLEEGQKLWGFFFPGKIRFTMQTENTGNVAFGPTRVVMEIRDSTGVHLLETTENLFKIKKIRPFEIKNIVAELPTRLPAGSYLANFKIFKNDEVVKEGQVNLSILPKGSLPGYKGFGFLGLRRAEQVLIVTVCAVFLAVLSLIGWMIAKWWRKRRVRRTH